MLYYQKIPCLISCLFWSIDIPDNNCLYVYYVLVFFRWWIRFQQQAFGFLLVEQYGLVWLMCLASGLINSCYLMIDFYFGEDCFFLMNCKEFCFPVIYFCPYVLMIRLRNLCQLQFFSFKCSGSMILIYLIKWPLVILYLIFGKSMLPLPFPIIMLYPTVSTLYCFRSLNQFQLQSHCKVSNLSSGSER